MPSTSPGDAPRSSSTDSVQVLPGAPTPSLQTLTSFVFRHKRYVAYTSGRQLNILTSPTTLFQAVTFTEDLAAVTAESHTGKVVVASKSDVYVLEPVVEGWTKVWWEKSLRLCREDAGDQATSLHWGSEGEVLVGGSRHLTLFSTLSSSRTSSPAASPVDGEAVEERKPLWSMPVPSPVQYAAFSPTAGLIATCGRYDRLVKIWRRLSFEEGLFDYMYLPHPETVTYLEWRPLDEHSEERRGSGISGRHDDEPEVLYTIASDRVLRVWRTGGMHDLEMLVLHTTVDLVSAIPQSPLPTRNGFTGTPKSIRYAFVIPSDNFCAAVTSAVARKKADKVSHSLEHMKEMASKSPDVIVTLDAHGRMSAWGLQSVGHKRRPETPGSDQAFHIAHAEGLSLTMAKDVNARFQAWFTDSTFQLLAHTLDGEVQWWQGDVETFFSTSASGSERLSKQAHWSGHTRPVKGLSSGTDGSSLISWTSQNEVVSWAVRSPNSLDRTAGFRTPQPVLDALPYGYTSCIVTLHKSFVVLWDSDGQQLAQADHNLDGSNSPNLHASTDGQSVIIFNETGNGVVASATETSTRMLELSGRFSVTKMLEGDSKPLHLVCASDVSQKPQQRTALDFRFVWIDQDGVLCRTTLSPSGTSSSNGLHEHGYASIETGASGPSILAANDQIAAIVSSDDKDLAVVELKDGYVEHRQSFSEKVLRLRCHSTSPGHNFLAVGFQESIEILAQSRYEHHRMTDTWTPIKRVCISDSGLHISSIEWLTQGSLAVGAGNGILLCDNIVSSDELGNDVQDHIDLYHDEKSAVALPRLGHYLKEPLPIWHPSLLSHLVRHGKPGIGLRMLHQISEKLKFWSEGEPLHHLLESRPEDLMTSTLDESLREDVVRDLSEQLDEKDLPGISTEEQLRLKRVIETLAFVSEHLKGLDMCAIRYLFSWKLQLSQSVEPRSNDAQPNGVPSAAVVPQMHWREIAFASQSTTQQPLLDILVLHYDNKLTWNIARSLGITAWLSDKEALGQVFESLAQSAYRQTSPPDPINASLYFLALHKKPTLIGLWRIATWHKEQRVTTNFLKRDFNQPDAKTAAKKNAYALMGKRRFEYAAAFFLLAGDAASAVSLLAGQCEDIMLAIAVARLYSGDGSPTLRKLLEDRLMPQAREQNDRWLMSWCYSILQQRDEAAEALIKPLEGVRTWHQDDSTTLMLYQQLRKEPSEHEYQAVLRAVRVLRRMGLLLLALDLVSTWKFQPRTPTPKPESQATTNGVQHEPPSMLDSFAEPYESAAEPNMDERAAREAKAAELLRKLKAKKEQAGIVSEKPQPTQFKEPDANSLLDNFGF